MANEYATLAELKGMRRIPTSDTADDTALQSALTRASRAIDSKANRRFYRDGVVSARMYRTAGRTVKGHYSGIIWEGESLLIDDIASTDGLIIETGDGISWQLVDDCFTEPDNALARGIAITGLRRRFGFWWTGTHARVTAEWGWPAVPDDIVQATLLLANRRFLRRDSPEGTAGWGSAGPVGVSRFDPDVEDLVQPYVVEGFGTA